MLTPVKLAGFSLCFLTLGAATLHQVQHARVGVAHDAVRNATVSGADCLRRIACDDPARFGGAVRGELAGARADAIRQCALPFLKVLEDGEEATVAIEPAKVLEGDEATVTVRIAFPCSVPLAGAVACGTGREIAIVDRERVTVAGCDQRD